MEKSTINLHMHTNCSLDGSESPALLLDECEQKGITTVSITDHDTCAAYHQLEPTKYTGKLITGIEADAMVGKETYDILCYGFDLDEVATWAKNQYGTVELRQQKIFTRLLEECEKIGIKVPNANTYNANTEYAHAALYRLLSETEQGTSFLQQYNINNVGDLYRAGTMKEDFPLYVDMRLVWPDIKEVKEIIHRNGGKIFVAHPYRYGESKVDTVLNNCLPYVDGIEICNDPENEDQVSYLYQYAKEHNLLMSAGSDYHGQSHKKHNTIYTEDLTPEMEEEITSWTKNYKSLIKK